MDYGCRPEKWKREWTMKWKLPFIAKWRVLAEGNQAPSCASLVGSDSNNGK